MTIINAHQVNEGKGDDLYLGMTVDLKTADGRIIRNVSADDAGLSYASAGVYQLLMTAGQTYELFDEGGKSGSKLSLMLNSYKGGNVGEYMKRFEQMYNAGYDKQAFTGNENGDDRIIYDAGAEAGQAAESKRLAKLKEAPKTNGEVTMAADLDMSKLTDTQKKAVDALKVLAKVTGVNFRLYTSKSEAQDDGYSRLTSENGRYDAKTNTIGIDLYSGADYIKDGVLFVKNADGKYQAAAQYTILQTAAHELTHYLEAYSPEGYASMRMFIQEQMGVDEFQRQVRAKAGVYTRGGERLTYGGAVSEVIADACSQMLNDTEAIAELAKQDKALYEEVRDFVDNYTERINEALNTDYRTPQEASLMRDKARDSANFYVRELAKRWDIALKEAVSRTKGTRADANATDTAAESHIGAEQLSIRQFSDAVGYQLKLNENGYAYAIVDPATGKEVTHVTEDVISKTPMGTLIDAALANKTIDEATAKKQREMFANLMNLVIKYKDSGMVWELAGANMFSAMKQNADAQYGTTIDFGTICSKTQAIVDELSAVMLKKGRGLTRQEVLDVYWATARSKQSVPCPVCYVFSRWMGVPSLL